MEYTCGHVGDVPNNMGRGQARVIRLAAYFDRVCYQCACTRIVEQATSATMLDGTPCPADKVQANITMRIEKIRNSYL